MMIWHELHHAVWNRGHVLRRWRYGLVLAMLCATVAPGCGLSGALPPYPKPVDIIRGIDDAGAAIQLEKRGAVLTNARVSDVVLGVGEAQISNGGFNRISFTIEFPAGAIITYVGVLMKTPLAETVLIDGIWVQHPEGIFGSDQGTWTAAFGPTELPRTMNTGPFVSSERG